MFNRNATARWSGGLQNGKGNLSTQSGALQNLTYGFNMRFGDEKGTNPEELIGAAHAGCFTMFLSGLIEKANFQIENLETTSTVTLDPKGGSPEISKIELKLRGRVPGISEDRFRELAHEAKENCPVSKLLKASINLDAQLETAPETSVRP